MLQPVEQVVAERAGKQVDVAGGIGNTPAGQRFRQIPDVVAAERDAAGFRGQDAGGGFGQTRSGGGASGGGNNAGGSSFGQTRGGFADDLDDDVPF